MKTHFVVTGVIKFEDKFLILKRASDSHHYPDKWSFCSGYAKEFESGEDAVKREVKEETGLDCRITTGDVIEAYDKEKDIKWVVAVYICRVDTKDVKLDKENVEHKWIVLDEMDDYDFVPGIKEDIKNLEVFKK